MPEIGSLKNVATISQTALPTAKRRGVQVTPVTSHGTHGYHFRQHLPSDARQPNISSFSAPSYTETSKMPFLIVSDTLYPATDMRTGHLQCLQVCPPAALRTCRDLHLRFGLMKNTASRPLRVRGHFTYPSFAHTAIIAARVRSRLFRRQWRSVPCRWTS